MIESSEELLSSHSFSPWKYFSKRNLGKIFCSSFFNLILFGKSLSVNLKLLRRTSKYCRDNELLDRLNIVYFIVCFFLSSIFCWSPWFSYKLFSWFRFAFSAIFFYIFKFFHIFFVFMSLEDAMSLLNKSEVSLKESSHLVLLQRRHSPLMFRFLTRLILILIVTSH